VGKKKRLVKSPKRLSNEQIQVEYFVEIAEENYSQMNTKLNFINNSMGYLKNGDIIDKKKIITRRQYDTIKNRINENEPEKIKKAVSDIKSGVNIKKRIKTLKHEIQEINEKIIEMENDPSLKKENKGLYEKKDSAENNEKAKPSKLYMITKSSKSKYDLYIDLKSLKLDYQKELSNLEDTLLSLYEYYNPR